MSRPHVFFSCIRRYEFTFLILSFFGSGLKLPNLRKPQKKSGAPLSWHASPRNSFHPQRPPGQQHPWSRKRPPFSPPRHTPSYSSRRELTQHNIYICICGTGLPTLGCGTKPKSANFFPPDDPKVPTLRSRPPLDACYDRRSTTLPLTLFFFSFFSMTGSSR